MPKVAISLGFPIFGEKKKKHMADPTNIVIEAQAEGFNFSGDLGQGRKNFFAKYTDYMPLRMGIGTADEYVHMKPLNEGVEIGRLYPANILSSPPFGTALDLYNWMIGNFNSASTTTYSVLLADLQNGNAPAGQWVFVSDILDRGAWLFCTSATEVAREGFGMFLDADFQSEGTYLASYSSHPCSQTNYGQWRPTVGNFLINHRAITNGPYTAGEPITTATWSGIYVSDDGAGTMTAYSVDGTSYPLDTETITGATSGATCDQVGTAGFNKLTGGGVVVYQDATSEMYQHYLCIDPAAINGGKTPDSDPAYLLLDRSVTSAGYIPVTDAIEYDINGNDTVTGKGWLIGRKNASHSMRLTEAMADAMGYTYSPLHSYPWGSPTVKGWRIDDAYLLSRNIGDLIVENITMARGSRHQSTLNAGCSVMELVHEADSMVEFTLNPGVSIENVVVKAGKSLTSKIFTDNLRGFTIDIDDTTPESRSLAPFGSPNLKRQMFKVTAADLANAATFGTLPGFELFTMPAGTYPIGTVEIQSFFGTLPFTLVSDFVIRVNNGSPQLVVARLGLSVINGATVDRSVAVPLSSNSGNTATQSIPYGATFYLSTAGATNLASNGDGYIVVIFEYYERCRFPM